MLPMPPAKLQNINTKIFVKTLKTLTARALSPFRALSLVAGPESPPCPTATHIRIYIYFPIGPFMHRFTLSYCLFFVKGDLGTNSWFQVLFEILGSFSQVLVSFFASSLGHTNFGTYSIGYFVVRQLQFRSRSWFRLVLFIVYMVFVTPPISCMRRNSNWALLHGTIVITIENEL